MAQTRTQQPLNLIEQRHRESSIGPGDSHVYSLELRAGEFAQLDIHQGVLDLVATVLDPLGRRLDIDGRWDGIERVFLIAEFTGPHLLRVRTTPSETLSDDYQVDLTEIRPASVLDLKRVEAVKLSTEAKQLLQEHNIDAFNEAISQYEQLLSLWREVGDDTDQASTLHTLAYVLEAVGEPEKALKQLQKAVYFWRQAGDLSSEAGSLHNMGAAASRLGRSEEALEYYEASAALRRALGETRNLALTSTNMATVLFEIGRYQESRRRYQEALELIQQIDYPMGVFQALNGIGVISSSVGDLQTAIDSYRHAAEDAARIADPQYVATTLNNLGHVFGLLGERETALDHYHRAFEMLRDHPDRSLKGRLSNNMGETYQHGGEPTRAISWFEEALSFARTAKDGRAEHRALSNLGSSYLSLGETTRALEYLEQGLELGQSYPSPRLEGETLVRIGDAYRYLGDRKLATERYRRALHLSRKIGDRAEEAAVLHKLASLSRDEGRFDQARQHLVDALEIVESLRSEVVSYRLRTSYFASVQSYYDLAVDAVMNLNHGALSKDEMAAGFEIHERSLARSLLDSLIDARYNLRSGVARELLDEERRLQQEINAKAVRLEETVPPARRERLQREMDRLLIELENVRADIRTSSPRYAALTRPIPLRLRQVQQLLDPRTLLLEYSIGDERSYLWGITRDSAESHRLPGRDELETKAARLYHLVTERNRQISGESLEKRNERVQNADDAFEGLARELSRVLLGPIVSELQDRQLLIVAEGALQTLPFAALPEPDSRHPDGSTSEPLIAKHRIVQLPSATILMALTEPTPSSSASSIALFGDPVFSSDDSRVEGSTQDLRSAESEAPVSRARLLVNDDLERSLRQTLSGNLVRLSQTRVEIERIAQLVPEGTAYVATDFKASKDSLQSLDLSRFGYLHLATHGLLNTRQPDLSGVVMSLVDHGGNSIDGFLRLHEIYNLNLNARLVVLSACETALGKTVRGEGIVGMARGFIYAGARSVIASIWRVQDRATAELMARLYRGMLVDQLSPAEALRRAQYSMWKEPQWKSPFFWAGFTFQGDWQ